MDIDFSTTTLSIMILVYACAEIMKHFLSDKNKNIIPAVCIIIGIFISVSMYLRFPGIIAVDNISDAIVCGGLSGIAATGCNQIWKQFQKFNLDESSNKDKEEQ